MEEHKAKGPADLEDKMTDILLEWMSFRGSGRVNDLPADLFAGDSAHRVVESLAVLGHVEFVDNHVWRVAPPVLACLPVDGAPYDAVLCGTRTAEFLSRLRAACDEHGVEVVASRTGDQPELVRVSSPAQSVLSEVADGVGLILQRSAAFTLLACTPTAQDWPRTPCPMVSGRVDAVRRFSRSRLRWVSSTLVEARASQSGFFRIKRDWDSVSVLKVGRRDSAYIDDRVGRLIVAANMRVASWDAETRIFSVPKQLFPPRVIARALALCTGTSPYVDDASQRICFPGVPPDVLKMVLATTGLRLR